eukprot:TRINITY_DN1141_c0_g1_i3.p2 TRINITY_DN1141_c0_g1~~TRINITY_DN1141_c0_g1_i3.p2  ORF type:complete len:170 (+),score=8.40 TRINITY_DN1141_c0_g1_i3:162-671(+)
MTIDVGTNRYQAPEVVNSSSYGLEADFFSLGSVLYFLVTGHAPFWRKTDAEVELKFASVGSLPEKERFADLNRWIIDQIGFHGLSDGDLKQQMPHVRVAHGKPFGSVTNRNVVTKPSWSHRNVLLLFNVRVACCRANVFRPSCFDTAIPRADPVKVEKFFFGGKSFRGG